LFPLKDNIPTEHFPLVTVLLIAINVAVFVFFQHPTGFSSVDDAKVVKYGAIPYELTHPGKHCGAVTDSGRLETQPGEKTVACEGQTKQTGAGKVKIRKVNDSESTWLTVLTSMFMHGGFLHILGNMLFLWIFGNNVEDAMGKPRFAAFYLLGGAAALAGQVVIDPGADVPTIGASGAIAAVLGGYLLLYPRARVLTLVFIIFFVTLIELPAIVMLGLWFLQQAYFGYQDLSDPLGGGSGVAYFAHIGGFAFGLLTVRALARRRKDPEPRIPVY
jgi:membrane associated rhomboid family serine protease